MITKIKDLKALGPKIDINHLIRLLKTIRKEYEGSCNQILLNLESLTIETVNDDQLNENLKIDLEELQQKLKEVAKPKFHRNISRRGYID